MTHERAGRLLAGTGIFVFYLLGLSVHGIFHLLLLLVGANLIQSAFTNKCPVKDVLVSLGFPGERDLAGRESSQQS